MKSISRFKCYFFPPLILLGIAVFSYVTMLLWNALLPELLHLPMINFWQALGLLILSVYCLAGLDVMVDMVIIVSGVTGSETNGKP